MAILDIHNLSLDFGAARILEGIDLAINEGEIVALVGESGSGKSLTALSVLGLQPDDAHLQGDIWLDGQSILNAPDTVMQGLRGRKIGMVFQEPLSALNPVMTIGDQVAETVRIHTG
ncbi:ATP-binding cassette domain-containing protein, partial [Brevundimonas sp.]